MHAPRKAVMNAGRLPSNRPAIITTRMRPVRAGELTPLCIVATKTKMVNIVTMVPTAARFTNPLCRGMSKLPNNKKVAVFIVSERVGFS